MVTVSRKLKHIPEKSVDNKFNPIGDDSLPQAKAHQRDRQETSEEPATSLFDARRRHGGEDQESVGEEAGGGETQENSEKIQHF